MADIAAEAGLSTGAVYRYFPGRDALLHALAEAGRGVGRALSREAERAAPGNAYDQLVELVRRYLAGMQPEAEGTLRSSVQLWGEAMRHPSLAEEVRATYMEMVERFTELVRAAQEAGVLRPELAPEEVARAVVSLVNEVGFQLALGMEVDTGSYRQTVETLLKGLRAESA